jgi:hypothetical protein
VPAHAPGEHAQAAWPYRRLDDATRTGGATPARDATSVDDATAGGGADPGLQSVTAVAIPYYAWANRGAVPMRVWLPLSAE